MATVKKKTKKAQYGSYLERDTKTNKFTRTTKSDTPDGPRYYKYSHPNESTTQVMNNMRARANSADSTRAKDIDPTIIKKLSGMKNGGKAKDGKWMQKAAASIKKRGTEGKCTPITKPGCTGKAKALAKTFKKIAAKRKSK